LECGTSVPRFYSRVFIPAHLIKTQEELGLLKRYDAEKLEGNMTVYPKKKGLINKE